MARIDELLRTLLERKGSDLHLRSLHAPVLRVDGVKPSLPKCSGKSMNRRCA